MLPNDLLKYFKTVEPTYAIPTFRIEHEGKDVTKAFNDRLVSLSVTLVGGGGGGDICGIVLDDRDWSIRAPSVGETITISLGYEGVGMVSLGIFEIAVLGFSGIPRCISLQGSATPFAMTAMKATYIKEYDKKTLGEIVEDLARQGGFVGSVESSLASKIIPYKNVTSSPYQVLHELERQFDAVIKINGKNLSFTPRDSGTNSSGQSIPTITLEKQHISSFDIQHSSRSNFSKIQASYFDHDSLTRKSIEVVNPVGSGPVYKIGRLFGSKMEAEASAFAQKAALNRSTGIGDIVLARGPWIKDQGRVDIVGMRDGIDGHYVIDTAQHVFSKDSGLQTTLKIRPPGDAPDYHSFFRQADGDNEFFAVGDFKVGTGGKVAGPV